MRPRLDALEVKYLVQLIRETEAKYKREQANIEEEQEHLKYKILGLRDELFYHGDWRVVEPLRKCRERAHVLETNGAWWTAIEQATVLKGLAVKFERLLAQRKGRMPYPVMSMHSKLEANNVR